MLSTRRPFYLERALRHARLYGLGGCIAYSLMISRVALAATELGGASLEVDRVGAEDCPDAERLRLRTLALGTPRSQPSGWLTVHVVFSREGEDYRATVATAGRSQGTRELSESGPSCESLALATSLVLAVVLDLQPRNASVGVPEQPKPAPRVPPPAAPAPRQLTLGARSGAALGLIGSGISVSFGGDVRFRLGRLELPLSLFAVPKRTLVIPPGFISVGLWAASAGVCAYSSSHGDEVGLGACVTFVGGRLHASSSGFYQDGGDASLWLAGAAGATLVLPLSRRWAVRVGLDAIVPFRQYSLDVERVGVVHDPADFAVALTIGPEIRFR